MTNEQIQAMIADGMATHQVEVTGDGHHFQAIVVSDAFDGLNLVKKQQIGLTEKYYV